MKHTESSISKLSSLRSICRNVTNNGLDTFVGIKSEIINNQAIVSINFPLGYEISSDDFSLRSEIIDLINVLNSYRDNESSIFSNTTSNSINNSNFPMKAYLYVINYYLSNGYYLENINRYTRGINGKINWYRTIHKEEPILQKNGFIYANYHTRTKTETDKELITQINKFCVYDSFQKIGWLFNNHMPEKPKALHNHSLYINVLNKKLLNTNNDKHQVLFHSMIEILSFLNNRITSNEFFFGTNNFHYIWENLIDDIFGVKNKEYFFPRTTWNLYFGKLRENQALEPDTIMINDNAIFILDAKYYKYGETGLDRHLPPSSSINKQITYGEFVANNSKFNNLIENNYSVYNAFLLPFRKNHSIFNTDKNYLNIGNATASWKSSNLSYERVHAILVDIKHLISLKSGRNIVEINNLADEILEPKNTIK